MTISPAPTESPSETPISDIVPSTSEDILINTTFDPFVQKIVESSAEEVFEKYIKDLSLIHI